MSLSKALGSKWRWGFLVVTGLVAVILAMGSAKTGNIRACHERGGGVDKRGECVLSLDTPAGASMSEAEREQKIREIEAEAKRASGGNFPWALEWWTLIVGVGVLIVRSAMRGWRQDKQEEQKQEEMAMNMILKDTLATQEVKQIATHGGAFHADDVLAVSLLSILYPEASVVRTRESEVFEQADLRVDVGGRSNARTGDFDHHFNNSPKRSNGVLYAASGLVWQHYGEKILAKIAGPGVKRKEIKEGLDKNFFEEQDRLDTGVGGTSMRANAVSWALCALTPTWQEIGTEENLDDRRFMEAVGGVKKMLVGRLAQIGAAQSVLEATGYSEELKNDILTWAEKRLEVQKAAGEAAAGLVRQAVVEAKDESIVMPKQGLPWQDVLHQLEIETGRRVLYVLEPVSDEISGGYVAVAVGVEKGSFTSRRQFPEAWAGKRGEELAEVSGLRGAVFCHPGRWISGWGSLAEAKEAVGLALVAAREQARQEASQKPKR